MSVGMYVSPEQMMKDRGDFARKGISRGRSVVVARYLGGILLVAENHSKSLHKVSEIYDRIGFAGVGRYTEFETLRIAGIRHADLRGYAYDRRDVTGRSLANAYAQLLGAIFAGGEKPFEVELIVAEVGESSDQDQLFRLTYDGSITDEDDFAVMGGDADQIHERIRAGYVEQAPLGDVLKLAVAGLAGTGRALLGPGELEVGVLDRTRAQQRKFCRISDSRLAGLLRD